MPSKAQAIAYPALMCAMLIVSTLWLKFSIPGTEILFTTQVFFVLLCGQLLPPRYCVYAIGAYLALGLIGLPVFSATQGLAVVATPTFGYLLGFPFGAVATSLCQKAMKGKTGSRYLASLAGILTMYLIALPYIALLKGLFLSAPVPASVLFSAYFLPFLPMDLIKGWLAALAAARLQKVLKAG